jgi:hypothetical protein
MNKLYEYIYNTSIYPKIMPQRINWRKVKLLLEQSGRERRRRRRERKKEGERGLAEREWGGRKIKVEERLRSIHIYIYLIFKFLLDLRT